MPLTVPPFSQFQGSLFPLRGLWRKAPAEGDLFVNAEIDWASYGASPAVQFSLSGNSPVALSQIVALYVDNRRCGVDCDFQFPDSGFLLTVPAHTQGLFPVLTNALMFYAIAIGAAAADVTILQILNSLPPPLALLPSQQQNANAVAGISATVNATTPIVPAAISGTLNTVALSIELNGGAAGGSAQLALIDGTGATLWMNFVSAPVSTVVNIPVNLAGLALRFKNGISLVVSSSAGLAAPSNIDVNLYYTTP